MNRLPAKLSSKLKKRNEKEIRKGQRLSAKAMEENEALTQEEWKKRHPHKPPSPQKRGMQQSKQPNPKGGKKQSKRTSPSEGIEGSVPAHVHSEGGFWQKILTKQGALQRKLFSKSFLKKK